VRVTNTLLVLLLATCVANLWLSWRTPHIIQQHLNRQEGMAQQTQRAKFAVTVAGTTETIEVEVTTVQGEDVPENVAQPPDSETRAQWNIRTAQTLKEAVADTLAVYDTGQ